ncbi:MAG: hypothetical protein KDE35_06600 [Geminicoccaceae bacterium]|nr:hypothetical protein [Geminicoccaceae bacterium]
MTFGALKQLTRTLDLRLGHYVGEFVTPGIGYMLKEAGCEYCFLDTEHSGMGFDVLNRTLRFMEAASMPTMVRVPSSRYDHIARALDVGAQGIVIPMLGSLEQARSVIASMKYTPAGRRGVAPGLGNDRYRIRPVTEMLRESNEQTVFVALIETAEGVAQVDEIAALPEIDVLHVGHFDMSCSLGIPGAFDDRRFLDAMARVVAAGRKHGKALGRMVSTPEEGIAMAAEGWNMICYGGDVWLYQTALRQGLDAIRREAVVGGAGPGGPSKTPKGN